MSEPVRFAYLLPELEDSGAGGKSVLRWGGGQDPFSAERRLDENPSLATAQIVPGAFSAEECARITAIGTAGTPVAGSVEKGYEAARVSEVAWIEPSPSVHWIYHRIGALIAAANRRYRFDLVGLLEPLQFAQYGIGGHFEWHTDLGVRGTSNRKLSLTVQLSDPAAYDGGELEFINMQSRSDHREVGTAVIFPSYLAHRVAPLTRGLRRSLVAWAYGPSLR